MSREKIKDIGIFICNYNKAEFVVKCVQAVMDQTYKNLDIFKSKERWQIFF